jgi:hypothetical protein
MKAITDSTSFSEKSGASLVIADGETITLTHAGVNELRLSYIHATRDILIKTIPPGGSAAAETYKTMVGGQPGLLNLKLSGLQINNNTGQSATFTYEVVGTDTGSPPTPNPNLSQNNTITGEIDVKVAGDGSDNSFDVQYKFSTSLNLGMIQFTSLGVDQDFDAKLPIDLPSNFASFQASAIQVKGLVDDIVNASFSVKSIIDTVGVERTLGTPLSSGSGTLATLTVPNTDTAITGGTFDASGTMHVVIQVQGDTSDNIEIWNRVKAFIVNT